MWNSGNKKVKSKPRGKAPSVARGVAAGLAVVAVAGVAFWLVVRRQPEKPAERAPAKSGRIAEVVPAVKRTAKSGADNAESTPPRKKDTRLIGKRGLPIETYGHKTYRDERGVLRYEGGLRVYDPNRPSRKLQTKESPPEIFPHSSENAIASIISIEPGDLIVGELEYGDDFIVDFNESLSHEIEYSEDDTEYTRRVKDAVKAVKKELHEAMNRGEDIVKIVNDAMNDLRNMSKYRQEITAMVSETADSDDAPDEDVKDVIEAANVLFRERGIKEIDDNEFIRMSLILERERNRSAGDPGEGGDDGDNE